nr:MAG TPA: hypothetical protein [Caudoviricetes sp.]
MKQRCYYKVKHRINTLQWSNEKALELEETW